MNPLFEKDWFREEIQEVSYNETWCLTAYLHKKESKLGGESQILFLKAMHTYVLKTKKKLTLSFEQFHEKDIRRSECDNSRRVNTACIGRAHFCNTQLMIVLV